jgi:hypothetical protein
MTAPNWARIWFSGAAIYGAIALSAGILLAPASPDGPRLEPLAFGLTALAFQIVFWIIGGDPVRYRPMMMAGVAEKLAFGVPALWFAKTGWADPAVALFALVDLVLGAGFALAWRATPASRGS